MTNGILGGALIGTAAGALYLGAGRIAGVSGMLARGLDPGERERAWRWCFIAGLVLGGVLVDVLAPGALPGRYEGSTLRLVTAGALVGVGARLANGCTSGHGLCGVARGSRRSLAALATFLATGAVTVLVARLVAGGAR
jgi:uncharacterized membrane protein YedE/YeeE